MEELIHMMFVKNYESIPFGSVEELIHMMFVKNEYIPSIFLSVEVTIHILSLIRPVPVSPEALHDDGSGNDRRRSVEGGSAGVAWQRQAGPIV